MTFSAAHLIPATPPAALLAELDAAARALDALTMRAGQLTVSLDEHAAPLRIELREDGGSRLLSPRQLFDLLA